MTMTIHLQCARTLENATIYKESTAPCLAKPLLSSHLQEGQQLPEAAPKVRLLSLAKGPGRWRRPAGGDALGRRRPVPLPGRVHAGGEALAQRQQARRR